MAFDAILQEKMKVRHKQGFKPPKRGRKTDLEGDAPVSNAHMVKGVSDEQGASAAAQTVSRAGRLSKMECANSS